MQKHIMNRLTAAVLLAVTCSAALAAGTQIPLTLDDARRVAEEKRQASIEIGARTVQASGSSTTDFQAWNGSDEHKSSLDMDMNLQGGTAAQGWSIKGRDLGTEIPELTMNYDKAGSFEIEGGYQRFTHATNVEAKILGEGVFNSDKPNVAELGVHETSLGVQRDVYRVGGRWLPTENLDLRADYQLDQRDGKAAAMIYNVKHDLVTDIDDTHHQVNASAEWSFDSFSLEASYYLSKYENDNPWMFRVGDDGNMIGGTTFDPSNTLHQVMIDGLWQISDTSSLSVAAGYAWNKLDDDAMSFMAADGTQLSPMIPRDLNYEAETKIPTFDIAYSARPLSNLSVSAKYGFRKYDNSVDASIPSPETDPNEPFYFHDQSRTEHKLSADAIYSFGKGYSVKGWGSMLDKDYESVIEGTTEWKGGIELRKRMSSTLSGKIAYQYTNRTADDWLIWGGTLGNDPDVAGKRWSPWGHAAYDEHALKANLFTQVTDALTLGFSGSVYTRDYRDATDDYYGMDSSDGWRFGVDADLAMSRDWSLFSFYEFDQMKTGNNQNETQNENGVMLIDDTKTYSHTIGLGVDLHPELQPWSFKMQYVYSYEKTETSSAPDVDYKYHYAEASGTWEVSPSWSLVGSVLFGKVDSDDYLRTGVYPGGIRHDELRESANYSAALFYVGVKYDLPM